MEQNKTPEHLGTNQDKTAPSQGQQPEKHNQGKEQAGKVAEPAKDTNQKK